MKINGWCFCMAILMAFNLGISFVNRDLLLVMLGMMGLFCVACWIFIDNLDLDEPSKEKTNVL